MLATITGNGVARYAARSGYLLITRFAPGESASALSRPSLRTGTWVGFSVADLQGVRIFFSEINVATNILLLDIEKKKNAFRYEISWICI